MIYARIDFKVFKAMLPFDFFLRTTKLNPFGTHGKMPSMTTYEHTIEYQTNLKSLERISILHVNASLTGLRPAAQWKFQTPK